MLQYRVRGRLAKLNLPDGCSLPPARLPQPCEPKSNFLQRNHSAAIRRQVSKCYIATLFLPNLASRYLYTK